MRKFYEVWVASNRYHKAEGLTYHSDQSLPAASIVKVALKKEAVLGLVIREVKKPGFITKALIATQWPPLPAQSLALIDWLKSYYPAPFGAIVQQFLPSSLSGVSSNDPISLTTDTLTKISLPALTSEQQAALTAIKQPGTFILHGRTGSGKTRVYQELAMRALAAGGSAIILVPEISLTSQLALNFKKLFGKRVIVLHSHLTPKERRLAWLTALNAKEPLVIIGARSALFIPLSKVGLIVIDEAHESAYKQEQAPYYHAIRVAGKLAELHKARLVLGSATPPLIDYYIAEQKSLPILRLNKLAIQKQTADVELSVVDLKDRSQFTRQPHISGQLIGAVQAALAQNEQALILLNRRGTARLVVCSVCGWQALCPRCDVPLTYHGDEHLMRCHICGYRTSAVSNCPVCSSTDILFKSAGTKTLMYELQSLFPNAKIQRFDSDNKKSERFENNYGKILRGEVDILVGTQMLAKGLDLPRLSVVGIINADTSLAIPDFTAQEKTYQLMSQVIGRIGRGHRHGKAIVQTYQPDSPMLAAALKQDWQTFYRQELEERRQFSFPPFCYLLKLNCRRASSAAAQKSAEQLAALIRQAELRVSLSGPAPALHERHGSKFEWQLVAKTKQRPELLKIIDLLPSGWSYDIDPVSLL